MIPWNSIVYEPDLAVSVIYPNVIKLVKNLQLKRFVLILGIHCIRGHHPFKSKLHFE